MRLKTLLYVFLVGCLCLACRPVAGPPFPSARGRAQAKPVEIRVAAPRRDAGIDPRVQGFADQHPEMTVVPYPIDFWRGGTISDRMKEEAEVAGSEEGASYVVYTRADLLAALAEEDLLLELSPFMQGTDGLTPDSFFPALIEPFQVGDKIFVLPVAVDPVMLYYNADLFARKGVPPPAADWTWDNLLQAAVKFAEPDANPPVYGLLVLETLPFIYQNGGSLVDDPVAPKHFTLDAPETVEAIQWLMDLASFYRVMPPYENQVYRDTSKAFSLIREGRVAMWVTTMSFRNYVGSNVTWPFQWGVAPLPQGRTKATVGDMEGVAILKNAANPRESWALVSYLVSHLPSGAGPLSQVPALRSLAESQDFFRRMPDKGVEAYVQSMSFFILPLSLTSGVGWRLDEVLWRNLEPAFNGSVDLREAMDAAQQEAERTLSLQ